MIHGMPIQTMDSPPIPTMEPDGDEGGMLDFCRSKIKGVAPGVSGRREGVSIFPLQQDISERKLVEVSLRESEEKYRSMMESMQDPVYICSSDYRVEYMKIYCSSFEGALSDLASTLAGIGGAP